MLRSVGARNVELSPRAARATAPIEGLAVFVASVLIIFPRLGSASVHGVIWAEDGPVALQAAYSGHGWGELFTPYQGYGMVLPRLMVSLISYAPLGTHGLLVVVSAVAAVAALGVFAFHVVRSHLSARVAALLVAAGAAAVPVGLETTGALVNLQWFLLFAACLAPLWQPRGPIGRAAAATVLVVTCLSSPFGAIPVVLAAVVWWADRRRDLLVLLGCGVAALAVQLVIMATAPPRDIPVVLQWNPLLIGDSYLRRVLDDGVLGIGRYSETARSSAAWPGVLVGLAVIALGVVVAKRQGLPAIALPALALVLSGVTYAAPVFLSNVTGAIPPGNYGRYSVAPTLLLFVAIGALVERAVVPAYRTNDEAAVALRASVVLPTALAAGLVAVLAFGMVTSWAGPADSHAGIPAWRSQVARAHVVCGRQPARRDVPIKIAPRGWTVSVPCARVRSG